MRLVKRHNKFLKLCKLLQPPVYGGNYKFISNDNERLRFYKINWEMLSKRRINTYLHEINIIYVAN